MSEDMIQDVREPRVYEIGYHLLPTLDESTLEEQTNALRKAITDLGGLPIEEELPTLMTLAYTMTKTISNKRTDFDTAYFGFIKFDVSPEQVEALNTWLDSNENVLRYLLIKTDREDTRAPKRLLVTPKEQSKSRRDTPREQAATDLATQLASAKAPEQVKEEPQDINPEELDKQIDELVGDE